MICLLLELVGFFLREMRRSNGEWNVVVHVMFVTQAAISAAMNSNLGRVTYLQMQLLGKHDGKTLPGR